MADSHTLGDILAGFGGHPVNRPGLEAFVANSQAMNGLRSAQTEEAMLNAQKASEQQLAMQKIEQDLVANGAAPSEASLVSHLITAGAGAQFKDTQGGLGEMLANHFTQTLGDPSRLNTPEQTAAAQALSHKIEPFQPVPNNYVPNAGYPVPAEVHQNPEATAQTGAMGALSNLRDTQQQNAAAAGGAMGGMSQKDIDVMGDRFFETGQLPALGMGASPLRAAIIRSATQRATGLRTAVQGAQPGSTASGAMVSNAAQAASGKSTLTALQKQANLIGAYEETAGANLDLAASYQNKLDETGSPLINRALLHFRTGVTGDPTTQQFVNALIAGRDEYARVLTSATGATGISDAARKEAEELFPQGMSPDMLGPAIMTAKQEMENRRQGYEHRIEAAKQGLSTIGGGASTTPSGGSPQPALPTGTPGSNNPNVPAEQLPPTTVNPVADNAAAIPAPGAAPPVAPAVPVTPPGGPQPMSLDDFRKLKGF